MRNFIPTEGHASQKDAIIARFNVGQKPAEIARALGLSVSDVCDALHSIRRQRVTLLVSTETADALRRAAERRQMLGAHLAAKLLTVIARDGLVDAVLDDGKGGC